MSSLRFTPPDPSNTGQPEPLLMIKGEHDPSEIILLDPPPSKVLFCLSQVAAPLHPETVEMVENALKNGTPLDVETLSRGTETSRAIIEERTTLKAEQGHPHYTRAVVISRLRAPEGEMSQYNDEDHRDLALHLTPSIKGKVEAILTWESEDLSTDLNMLRERWERFDNLYKDMGLPPPPFDLGPLAHDPSGQDPDPLFDHEDSTIAAYLTPPDVILSYQDPSHPGHDDERGLFTDDDDDGFSSSDEDESSSFESEGEVTDTEEDFEHDLQPEPGDELVIINPTPMQLAKIARLSGTPLKTQVIERVMKATQMGDDLTPENFSTLQPRDIEDIHISAKRTFELAGGLRRTHSMTLSDNHDRDGVGFSITLMSSDQTGAQRSTPLQAILTWELFDIDAHIKNWDAIIKVASSKRSRG